MSDSKHQDDVAFIQALAELLRENDLTELRVKREYAEDDSLDVRVSRGGPAPAPMMQAYAPQPAAPQPATAAEAPAAPADPASDPGAVPSPMVGTVYLAGEPGAAPFVQVGDKVEEGATLLIVEAMKTMNHIPAPRSGTVKDILVPDGAPVEYGTPLVILA
ncbi:Biotin carboxyl carrier protein of acetyl-CoA carboxylase [Rhodobacteraceae bacterium THAF1]|uniref:acetyl-CoA carboxylase biotin carboxyl carrier protein n=1 Tax=Palleronia sp. THAF1 TaxID=2587842 RepID=UPI000F3B924C|nr:acetyl-CoA carboxylase biotin carboxyl carrier protein [Palleronia sp. THAF1]QFU09222.1 Biotin carboxyl carrier protein of acetyl-CoA carboxylase [Palleronia sp. THAF1]VDC27348.1 Biotin carboxyl carrier protein of acetyl-CoA carboxylase [Rhodobacteraceae bacterium THAF1]